MIQPPLIGYRVLSTRNYRSRLSLPGPGVTSTTSRWRIIISGSSRAVRVLVYNPPDGVAITVKTSMEFDSVPGVRYPFLFSGVPEITLNPGDDFYSDLLFVPVTKGDVVQLYTFVDGGVSNVLGTDGNYSSSLGGIANSVDYTLTGTVPAAVAYVYVPCALVGVAIGDGLLIIGDSIAFGQNGNSNSSGYPYTAFGNSGSGYDNGLNANMIHTAEAGEAASDWTSRKPNKASIFQFGNKAIVELGINDLLSSSTASQIWDSLNIIYNDLVVLGYTDIRQCTITPNSSSTDGWATTTNQTTSSVNVQRVILNDLIRTVPSPLAGYFEIADIVETTRNSGIWKSPGYTADGIHPADVSIYALMAAGIDTTRYVLSSSDFPTSTSVTVSPFTGQLVFGDPSEYRVSPFTGRFTFRTIFGSLAETFNRLTEASDSRITEAGDQRVTG